MMNNSVLSRVFALSFLGAVAIAVPCVPPGGSVDVDFDRPPLPSGGTWVGTNGDPEMTEDDFGMGDEDMGGAVEVNGSGGDKSVGTVSSDSEGGLMGPNGGVQNGGTEGKAIEVKCCWDYEVWVIGHFLYNYLGEPVMFVPGMFQIKTVCSDTQDVKPC